MKRTSFFEYVDGFWLEPIFVIIIAVLGFGMLAHANEWAVALCGVIVFALLSVIALYCEACSYEDWQFYEYEERRFNECKRIRWERAHEGMLRFEIVEPQMIESELQEFMCKYNIKQETYKENGKTWWVASQKDFDGLRCNFPYNVIGGYKL